MKFILNNMKLYFCSLEYQQDGELTEKEKQ